MAPGFKVHPELTAVWTGSHDAIKTRDQWLKSGGDEAELGPLFQSDVIIGLDQKHRMAGDNAFLDSRPELPALVGHKHAIVLSRNRLEGNSVSVTVLTYVDDIGPGDLQWPSTDQTCTIGSVVDISKTMEPRGPATTLMRSLIETGRVQENGESFRFATMLSRAAINKECQMRCTSFKPSNTQDEHTGRNSYTITAEFIVSGTGGFIGEATGFARDVRETDNWQSGCTLAISRFVNNDLQKVVEESLGRFVPGSSLKPAERAARLGSRLTDWVTHRGGQRVRRYGDITSEASPDKKPEKDDPFVVTVQTKRDRMVLVIRDSTLGTADTHASGASSTPIGAPQESQAGIN